METLSVTGAEHRSELDNPARKSPGYSRTWLRLPRLKKAHLLPYCYVTNEKLSAFEDSMAQETELLYVVTVVVFILICDLIMSWFGSRRNGNSPK